MSNLEDIATLYKREMLVFKAHMRTNIMRSIIFPIVLIFFFGNIGASTFGVKVAVVNYANNPQSLSFINSLGGNQVVYVSNITTQTEAINLLSSGKVSAVIIILPSFPRTVGGSPSVDVYYSNSNFVATGAMVPYVESLAQQYDSGTEQQPGVMVQAHSNVSARPLYGTAASYKVFLVGGILMMVAAFGTMNGSGMSLISDRELGNLKSFIMSPIHKSSIVLSKMLAGTTQSLLYILLALIIGLLDGATVAMGWLGIAWIFVLGGLVSLGFAGVSTVLAARIAKVEVYALMSTVIIMPLWFLSGAFFPATSLPTFMQPFATYNPMTYATQGVRNVMMLGYYPMSQMLLDLGALGAFVAVGLIASLLLFKSNID